MASPAALAANWRQIPCTLTWPDAPRSEYCESKNTYLRDFYQAFVDAQRCKYWFHEQRDEVNYNAWDEALVIFEWCRQEIGIVRHYADWLRDSQGADIISDALAARHIDPHVVQIDRQRQENVKKVIEMAQRPPEVYGGCPDFPVVCPS